MFKLKELFQTIEGYGYKYSGIDFIKSVGMYTIIIAYLAHLHHLKFIVNYYCCSNVPIYGSFTILLFT